MTEPKIDAELIERVAEKIGYKWALWIMIIVGACLFIAQAYAVVHFIIKFW